MVYPSALSCLIVVWLTIGKVIFSIPKLYEESKSPGIESCMDLTFTIFFRIMGILVVYGVIVWGVNKLNRALNTKDAIDFFTPSFIALFLSGFGSYFVLMITLLVAKLAQIQGPVKESDNTILDD